MKNSGTQNTKICRHPNATVGRTHNRSIAVIGYDSDVYLEIRSVSNDLSPRAKHEVLKGKVVSTTLRLTEKSASMLYLALEDYLSRVHKFTKS